MTSHGDDCYFFYYSTCTKGDSCPFRHCEAAMGSETVCTLWQEDRCFRKVCKFRHMEIKKKRNEIPCYWENQPAGCQKPHCAFHHEKPRIIDGMFVPPSKAPIQKKDVEEEPVPVADPPPPAPVPSATPANPQLRGVIKAETLENVPSPTHPPVVINPADDEDEDEDDQFSEEGDESSSRMVSPRKLISSTSNDDSLNFGIRTLEEIRLRKALKANLKKAGQISSSQSQSGVVAPPPGQNHNGSSGEKENIKSFIRPSHFSAREDSPPLKEAPLKRRVAERLGKRKVTVAAEHHFIVKKDVPEASEPPLKRTLAERLGRKVDDSGSAVDPDPQKAVKPMRDRLGLPSEPAVPDNEREVLASGEIRIKTLEEIRQEKAAKSQGQGPVPAQGPATAVAKAAKRAPGPVKRTAKPPAGVRVKTFSELLRERKRQQEEEAQQRKEADEELPAGGPDTGKDQAPAQGESVQSRKAPLPLSQPQPQPQPQPSEVRVKTLEEIRNEKAARMQAKEQEKKAEPAVVPPPALPKRRILRLNKTTAAGADNGSNPSTPEASDKPAASITSEKGAVNGPGASPGGTVKVKTFQEIMQEKRLRRQQGERPAAGDQPSPPTTWLPRQRAAPKTATPTPGPHGDTLKQKESDPGPAARSPKSAPAPDSTTPAESTPPAAGPLARVASPSAIAGGSDSAPAKREASPSVPATAQSEGAAPCTPAQEESQGERTRGPAPKRSPVHTAETKVRPKLNVKPSVVKAASQVKLGQKRKTPDSHRSAVAAVKPLNSAPSAVEDQAQKPSCKRASVKALETAATSVSVEAEAPVFPQDLGVSSPTTSSPSQAELHRPANMEQSPAVTEPVLKPAKEPPATPQSSPAVRTPLQPKTRRQSTTTPRSAGAAALDDLDELMNEFADDPLDGDMELDPAKDEDDLLLELSEMIDS